MISGARAFPQKTLSELVQSKTKGQYAPLTQHGLSVPKELAAIIDKAMALDTQDRFDTAADFGRKLYEVLLSLTDMAPQDIILRYIHDPTARFDPPKRRQSASARVALWLLGIAVVALSGAVAFLLLTR
jgi:hypothetical protein